MAKKAKKPLKATDRRRAGAGDNVKFTVSGNDGTGRSFGIFNDRRKPNGHGKKMA
ncbi:hypothetical protein [Microbispora sp. NPDC049633]|uniref:hypothetical protein n=1 Tax=Microbispora sp. NPDC049633 TaxID=3154355 RepID=UPI0034429792